MLISAPLLLAIRAFGGVPGWYILAVYTLTFATALVGAQLAIFLSIKSKRAGGAFMSAMSLLVSMLVAIPLLAFVALMLMTGLMNAAGPPPAWVQWIFVPSSPGVMFFLSTEVLSPDAPFSNWGSRTWVPCILSLLGIWAVLFLASSLRLRSVMMADVGGSAPVKLAKAPKGAKAAAGNAAAVASAANNAPTTALTTQDAAEAPQAKGKRRASRVRAGVSREVGDPAVFWRERELRLMKTGVWTRRITTAVLVLAVLGLYWLAQMHQAVAITLAIVGFFGLLLNASGVNAASIAGEREGRTLDVLLCSPVSSADLVRQKFLGGFVRLWPIWALILAHLLAFNLSHPLSLILRQFDLLLPRALLMNWSRDMDWIGAHSSVWTIPMFLAAAVPPIAMLCASGVYFSTITRKTTRASVFNVLLALLLWLGLPALVGIFSSIVGESDLLMRTVLWPNPFVIVISPLITLIADRSSPASILTADFNLPDSGGLSFLEMWLTLALVGAFYLVASAIFLRMAAARLRRQAGM
jgi:hypothetical protein